MFILRFLLISLSLIGLSHADISEAFHTIDLASPQPPTRAEDVMVYTYLPKSNYKIIGKIYARGMAEYKNPDPNDVFGAINNIISPPKELTEKDDIDLAMNAIAEDAAKIGSNGVIILSSQQIRLTHNSSERKIIALAFRIDHTENTAPSNPTPTPQNTTNSENKKYSCSASSDCKNTQFCYSGRCATPHDYNQIPRAFPSFKSSAKGQKCAGDEHCTSGLYCSYETNKCVAD